MSKKQIMRLCDPDPQGKRNKIIVTMTEESYDGNEFEFCGSITKGAYLLKTFWIWGDVNDIDDFLDTLILLNPNVEVEIKSEHYKASSSD